MAYVGSLLSCVHEGLKNPELRDNKKRIVVRGTYDYFHYCCDGMVDKFWGCGYRTLQTICSWILRVQNVADPQRTVPSIYSIQKSLVDVGDKPSEFWKSSEWIGSIEVGYVLNHLYGIDFRIVHICKTDDWDKAMTILAAHFEDGGSPVMMGGKVDASSKCIVGTFGNTHLLIVDPHFVGVAKHSSQLQLDGWVRWEESVDFCNKGFFNICIPQIKLNF